MTIDNNLSFYDRFDNLYRSQDLYGASLCNPLMFSNDFFDKKIANTESFSANVAWRVGKLISALILGLLAFWGIIIKLCHTPFLNKEIETQIKNEILQIKHAISNDGPGSTDDKFNSLKRLIDTRVFIKKVTWQHFRRIDEREVHCGHTLTDIAIFSNSPFYPKNHTT